MAYGQTGSGKTYTMLGPPAPRAPQGHAGIIPRAAEELFRYLGWQRPCRAKKGTGRAGRLGRAA